MQNGPQIINSPEEAVAQIQAIFKKYIEENKGWKDKAEKVRSDFYTAFHLTPEGSVPVSLKLSLDEMKKYVQDKMLPQFVSLWAKAIWSDGWSHLRTDLENAAKSWPTQLQYMEKQFELMYKKVKELEAEVIQLKALKKPEIAQSGPEVLVAPLQQMQVADNKRSESEENFKLLNDRLVKELSLIKAKLKALQESSQKATATESAPTSAPIPVPVPVCAPTLTTNSTSSGAAITHQHKAEKKSKKERRSEAAKTRAANVVHAAQPKTAAP